MNSRKRGEHVLVLMDKMGNKLGTYQIIVIFPLNRKKRNKKQKEKDQTERWD